MTLIELIKKYRKEHDLSQREFARMCGLSNAYISIIEKGVNQATGKQTTPNLQSLKQIAAAMNMTLDELLYTVDDMQVEIKANFQTRLDIALKMREMTAADLAHATGIKESAISQYRRGAYKATQKNLELIANALNVSIPWLMGISDNITPRKADLSAKALQIAKAFDALDEWGKQVVSDVVRDETARIDAERLENEPKKTIPLMENRLAAGYADPDFDNGTSEYEIPASVHADFAIHVHGTSMEPYLHDGDIALGINRKPKHGEIGAFLLNGEYLVKQYITDHIGNVYLLSLNRNEADKDVRLMRTQREFEELWTFGTIITEKKIPLPKV